MNDMVKMSIDGRKNAFYSAYEINDDNIKKEIDELFSKIEELGKNCKDATEFETTFATSPLNTEYINLFTKVAQSCKPIVYEHEEKEVKSDEEFIKEEIKSDLKYQAKEATLPARRVVREEVDRAARNTPILGDVIQAKQTMDLFGKFRKKKDD